MAVECRYYGWDKLPAETARAPRGSETCTLISLQSTRIAMEKARAEARAKAAGKKPAAPRGLKYGIQPREKFLRAFVSPNERPEMPTRRHPVNRWVTETQYYPEGVRCAVFDPAGEYLSVTEGGVWSHPPIWVASVADLDPAIQEVLGSDVTLLVVLGFKSGVSTLYSKLSRVLKGGEW